MKPSLRERVTKLEELLRIDPLVLHFTDVDEEPMTFAGTARSFFRIMTAMDNPQASQEAQLQLDGLRRAERIEGRSAQLFYLGKALAMGPAPDSEPQPHTTEKP